MIQEWRYRFSNSQLERGYDLFYRGCVHLKQKKQNTYLYQVFDQSYHFVKVVIRDHIVSQLNCDCSEEGLCAHMVAALLCLENPDQNGFVEWYDVAEVMERLSTQQKEQLLLQLLAQDDCALQLANTMFSNSLTEKQQIALKLNAIFLEAAKGHMSLESFEQQLLDFIHQDLSIQQDPYLVLDQLKHLLSRLKVKAVDERYESFSRIEQEAFALLEKIIMTSSELEAQSFAFLMADSEHESYLEFLFDHFQHEPYLKQKLTLINQKISKVNQFEAWARDFYLEKYILKKIQVLYDLQDESELRKITQTYWRFSRIRAFWIQEAIDHQDYIKAIDILQESLIIDQAQPRLQLKYTRMILDLYELLEDPRYRETLEQLLFVLDPGDFDDYLRYKALFQSEDWPAARQSILDSPMSEDRRFDILLAEGLDEAVIKQLENSANMLEIQEKTYRLLKKYPTKMPVIYINLLSDLAGKARNREQYKDIARLIRQPILANYQKEAITALRKKYPKKRALFEELESI